MWGPCLPQSLWVLPNQTPLGHLRICLFVTQQTLYVFYVLEGLYTNQLPPPSPFSPSCRDKSQWEGKLREELEQEGFSRVRLVWLVANTMSERTCLAWKEPRVLTQGVRVSGC